MSNSAADNSSSSKARTIYDRAALNGLFMGVYFSVLFLGMVGSMRFEVLNLPVIFMIAATPFIVFRQMRRTHVAARGLESFSGLWMQGILTFCCGSLILCAVSYAFLRWCYPEFIYDSCVKISRMYLTTPELQKDDIYNIAEAIVNNRYTLRAADMAVAYFWMGSFTGSVLSMILALIVKRTKINQ